MMTVDYTTMSQRRQARYVYVSLSVCLAAEPGSQVAEHAADDSPDGVEGCMRLLVSLTL